MAAIEYVAIIRSEVSVTPVRAADVFIYVGYLSSVFELLRGIHDPAGCFAFTVELAANGQEIQLLPSLRCAHSDSYVRR